MVEGSGYSIQTQGEPLSVDFFSTRVVKAVDESQASLAAVEAVRKEMGEKQFASNHNSSLRVVSIKKARTILGWIRKPSGFTFFES
jgi:hypothetical protein